MPKVFRNAIVIFLLGIVALGILMTISGGQKAPKAIKYSEFTTLVGDNKINDVTINGNKITGKYNNPEAGTPKEFYLYFRPENKVPPEEILEKGKIRYDVKNTDTVQWWLVITNTFPIFIIIGFFYFIMRQAQGSGGQAFNFGRSKHKLVSESRVKVTFDDVAGVVEAKQELAEIVDYLKFPKKYESLGARIPKGVLLLGSPGTGKTLLGRAVAGEAKVPFYYISGSDFVELFVGVGASRVRDLFEQAKRTAPCIVFVDEIDAVGRQRGAGLGGGHDEREQTLNQLLVEMDGFDGNVNVIVLAATNRPDVLDPALLRPGRFDRQVVVDRPDMIGRMAILKVHSRGKPLGPDVELGVLARRTPGFSGAELENMLNEAALLAARSNRDKIQMTDCEEAIDRVNMGPERKSRVQPEDQREKTAYHEAGHAIVARSIADASPVHKVTILPRGQALGLTFFLPEDDRLSHNKEELLAMIAVLMGGRAAEEVTFGKIWTGATNDIERATSLARDMVCRYGMSEHLGPVNYGRKESQVFLGRDIHENRDFSEAVSQQIDAEVRTLVQGQYDRAKRILTEKRDQLELLTRELVKSEILEEADLDRLLGPSDQKKQKAAAEPVKAPLTLDSPVA